MDVSGSSNLAGVQQLVLRASPPPFLHHGKLLLPASLLPLPSATFSLPCLFLPGTGTRRHTSPALARSTFLGQTQERARAWQPAGKDAPACPSSVGRS